MSDISFATLSDKLPLFAELGAGTAVEVSIEFGVDHTKASSDARMLVRSLDQPVHEQRLDAASLTIVREWLEPLRSDQEVFRRSTSDGVIVSGHLPKAASGQLRIAWPARVSGFAKTILGDGSELPLRELLRLGSNLWIVGDTGLETEFACSLIPDSATAVVRTSLDRPAPRGFGVVSAEVLLSEALAMRMYGGYDHLVFAGALTADDLAAMADAGRVVVAQRAASLGLAISRSRVAEQPQLAALLGSFAVAVQLERQLNGHVVVSTIYEFRSAEEGIDVATLAERRQGRLQWLDTPSFADRLRSAGSLWKASRGRAEAPAYGVEVDQSDDADEVDVSSDFDVSADDDNALLPPSVSERRAQALQTMRAAVLARRSEGRAYGRDPLSDDPGWELDAREEALISAPGVDGSQGMMRARPMVRPSAPQRYSGGPLPAVGGNVSADDFDQGKLTLDAPPRRSEGPVIIPEAPGGMMRKRSFAEILKERHRYPPVSADGSPTLTPPVMAQMLDAEDDEQDITPE